MGAYWVMETILWQAGFKNDSIPIARFVKQNLKPWVSSAATRHYTDFRPGFVRRLIYIRAGKRALEPGDTGRLANEIVGKSPMECNYGRGANDSAGIAR